MGAMSYSHNSYSFIKCTPNKAPIMIFLGQITADACCVTARRCTSPDCYGNCRRVKSVCKCILNSKVFSIFLTNYSLKVKLMKLGSLWIYVAALTPSSWNNPCCPPPYPTPIPPTPLQPFQALTSPLQEHAGSLIPWGIPQHALASSPSHSSTFVFDLAAG